MKKLNFVIILILLALLVVSNEYRIKEIYSNSGSKDHHDVNRSKKLSADLKNVLGKDVEINQFKLKKENIVVVFKRESDLRKCNYAILIIRDTIYIYKEDSIKWSHWENQMINCFEAMGHSIYYFKDSDCINWNYFRKRLLPDTAITISGLNNKKPNIELIVLHDPESINEGMMYFHECDTCKNLTIATYLKLYKKAKVY
jgi:hypothetical protein